jgi:hypothetical protein
MDAIVSTETTPMMNSLLRGVASSPKSTTVKTATEKVPPLSKPTGTLEPLSTASIEPEGEEWSEDEKGDDIETSLERWRDEEATDDAEAEMEV